MEVKENNVDVSYPVNLKIEDKVFFPDLAYKIKKEKVYFGKNVYVSRSGICLKNFCLLKESVHKNCRHYFFHFYKVALGSFFFYKRIRLNSVDQCLVVHNIWSNGYYHWICEALPRLWRVKDQLSLYTLLLPETYKGYQLETLKEFKFKNILFFPSRTGFLVDKLVLPPNPGNLYEPDPAICNSIREFYLGCLNDDLLRQFNFGERIYLSRKRAKRRKVNNEDGLEDILLKYGFKILAFEDYDFWQQVVIMNHARYFISIHGAGLTNIQFMKSGGRVLELYKKREPKIDYTRGRQNDLPSPCYCRLASALGHQHYFQFCEAVDPKVPTGSADLVADKTVLEKNIQLMLTGEMPFAGISGNHIS